MLTNKMISGILIIQGVITLKKSIVITAALSIGLLGGVTSTNSSANASKIHKGLPSSIKNSKWRSKRTYIKYRDHYERSNVHFHKSSLTGEWAGGVDPFGASKIKYKYVGHHSYKLYGRQYGNEPAGGAPWHGSVKIYNSHKIHFNISPSYAKVSKTFYRY